VTSGTVNNTEAGAPAPTDTTPVDNGTPDGGGDNGDTGAALCTTNTKQDQNHPIRSAGCQQCLNNRCCTELTNCFNITPDAGTVGCNDYHECLDNCIDTDGGTTCEDQCDTATGGNGVVDSYDKLAQCANTNCAACQ
jgi:hypothetical protein